MSPERRYLDNINLQRGKSFRLRAHAKINLRLKFLGRRQDGFHLLSMINSDVDLSDELTVGLLESDNKISLHTTGQDFLGHAEDNLVVRAIREFFQRLEIQPPGFEIHLTKNIPSGAGLGGGSGDAATVIKLLGDLTFGSEVKDHQTFLESVAAKIGSDVVYSLTGGLAKVSGVGEIIQPLPTPAGWHGAPVCIIFPPCKVSTPAAYAFLRERHPVLAESNDEDGERRSKTYEDILDLVSNDFIPIIEEKFPEIAAARSTLLTDSSLIVSMSGSGSALFVVPRKLSRGSAAIPHSLRGHLEGQGCRCVETHFH